ncbi:MAG: hypothetical protein KUA43_15625 [Hoeflea sp.]|uniref:hypothetical protein n=1 Tax=Hoeflea sp. TaxID=1940281 RepID=UPI001D68194B|nr:hypothetical protein [Hoeflea sp.]MBU4531592.1 hypothetical protein [Alphaproteobacteria bacterium]MBU4544449.1 hypothetical protein [Alphaproteobacteria bacterium]MBU4550314.1 hypothetical protein [Alphaproteobacteria bacterium]MBV1724868.1 hypothetical protein [Hoeflea sp.]MBV1760888.1 hypothetical protein [Hoeflea sp.]
MKTTMILTAAAMLISVPAFAGQKLAAPQDGPMLVKSAQFAIKSPASNTCPAPAKSTGWIFTSKPGTVSYMIVRKGGGVAGPFKAEAVKAASGAGAMATIKRDFEVNSAIDAEYRILVAGSGGIASNWAPLRASCKIQLGG